jgi:hypothetical protein
MKEIISVKNINLHGTGRQTIVKVDRDAEVIINDCKGGSGYDTYLEATNKRATIIGNDDDLDIRLKGEAGIETDSRIYQIVNTKNEFDIKIQNDKVIFNEENRRLQSQNQNIIQNID